MSAKSSNVPAPASLGWPSVFDSFDSIFTGGPWRDAVYKTIREEKPSFPPYNVYRNGDQYLLKVALAGFEKNKVEVTHNDRVLAVSGSMDDLEVPEGFSQTHRGIAQRSFELKLQVPETFEVDSASWSDGLLTIEAHLNRAEPEIRKIEIS